MGMADVKKLLVLCAYIAMFKAPLNREIMAAGRK
jgi:hypothetical protein